MVTGEREKLNSGSPTICPMTVDDNINKIKNVFFIVDKI
jgi:hypothetical protein